MSETDSPPGESTDRHPTGRWWLVVPVVGLYAADVAFTLSGQPPTYWAGDHAAVNEINPIGHALLSRGPWAFVGVAAVWGGVASVVVLLWRHRVAIWGAKVLAVGHAIGGACWLARHGGWWLAAGCGYLALAAVFAGWCWRRAERTP